MRSWELKGKHKENIKTQNKRITRIIFLGVKRLNKIKILFLLKDKCHLRWSTQFMKIRISLKLA